MAAHLRGQGGGPRGVQADAEVCILHDGQRAIVAAHARKVGRPAEQRLVAEQQLGAPGGQALWRYLPCQGDSAALFDRALTATCCCDIRRASACSLLTLVRCMPAPYHDTAVVHTQALAMVLRAGAC